MKNGESAVNNSITDPNPSNITFFRIKDDGLYAEVIKEKAKEVFYHDCDDNDIEIAIDKLGRQPLKPITGAISISDAKFGKIPKYFIECTEDKIFSIEYQRLLQKQFPLKQVFTINTGHSPFLAEPRELAHILNKIE